MNFGVLNFYLKNFFRIQKLRLKFWTHIFYREFWKWKLYLNFRDKFDSDVGKFANYKYQILNVWNEKWQCMKICNLKRFYTKFFCGWRIYWWNKSEKISQKTKFKRISEINTKRKYLKFNVSKKLWKEYFLNNLF